MPVANATVSVQTKAGNYSRETVAARRASLHANLVNVAPSPDFLGDCGTVPTSVDCVSAELSAIDNARTVEAVAGITVDPTALAALSAVQQLFVLTNLERVARGLVPATELTSQLNAVAASGALTGTDPKLNGWNLAGGAGVTQWGSNWAGDLDVFGSDYFWMYDDGVGANIDCPNASASGCWGHRDNVLLSSPTAAACGSGNGSANLVMGAAVLPTGYHQTPSLAEIMVGTCGHVAGVTFTWRTAERLLGIATPTVAAHLRRHR